MSDYAVVNPATGETIKEFPTITDDELRGAIERADGAYKTWTPSSTAAERAAIIRKVADLHSERREELAAIIVGEMGKPVEQALMEVDFCGEIYGFYADNAEEIMADTRTFVSMTARITSVFLAGRPKFRRRCRARKACPSLFSWLRSRLSPANRVAAPRCG